MKKRFLNWIRRTFFPYRNQIIAKDVLSGGGELTEISATAFLHAELTRSLHRDMVILIVSNNFIAEPGLLLSHFSRNYSFTIDEFVVLSYKLGMMTKMYIENPIYLLKDAIKLIDVFSESTIIQLEQLLKEQILRNETNFEQKFNEFYDKIEENKKKSKLRSIDIEADEKIDEWLRKNKKN